MVDEGELAEAVVGVDRCVEAADLARYPGKGGRVAATVPSCVQRVEIVARIESHVGAVIVRPWFDRIRIEVQFQPELVLENQVLLTKTRCLHKSEMTVERRGAIETTTRKDRNLRESHVDNLGDPPVPTTVVP